MFLFNNALVPIHNSWLLLLCLNLILSWVELCPCPVCHPLYQHKELSVRYSQPSTDFVGVGTSPRSFQGTLQKRENPKRRFSGVQDKYKAWRDSYPEPGPWAFVVDALVTPWDQCSMPFHCYIFLTCLCHRIQGDGIPVNLITPSSLRRMWYSDIVNLSVDKPWTLLDQPILLS